MADMIFYEKPGCLTNRRQKAILQAAGVELEIRNLLTHPWQANELHSFLEGLPISEWFNPAAPQLKSSEVSPASLSAGQAMQLLLSQPLMIRRPLMEFNGYRTAGFDLALLRDHWGIALDTDRDGQATTLDQCSRKAAGGQPT